MRHLRDQIHGGRGAAQQVVGPEAAKVVSHQHLIAARGPGQLGLWAQFGR